MRFNTLVLATALVTASQASFLDYFRTRYSSEPVRQSVSNEYQGLFGNSSGNGSFPTPANTTCTACNLVNIVVVIDTSQSIPPESFDDVKDWLANTWIEAWNIGPDNVRFGLITFHSEVDVEYDMDEATSVDELKELILGLGYKTGSTNIEKALRAARDLFEKGHRQQPGAPTALLLFSDGSDELGSNAGSVADDIRYKFNTRVICVGVPGQNGAGPDINMAELETIAGDPAYVFPMKDIDQLPSLFTPILDSMACCACYADIVVVVETSELVYNYTEQANIIKRLAAMLDVAPKLSHMAVVHFSDADKTGTVFELDDDNSYNQIDQAMDWFVSKRDDFLGLSDVAAGLKETLRVIKKGDRDESPNAVIFMGQGYVDHADNCCPDPSPEIKELLKVAEVYALKTGPRINEDNLLKLTGDKPDQIAELQNYTQIAQMIGDGYMEQSGCKPHPIPPCHKLDAVLIFDASASINRDCPLKHGCFETIKKFAAGIVQSMEIGPDHVQFGLLVFGDKVDEKSAAKPNRYKTNKELINAIDRLPYLDSWTGTNCALERVQEWIEAGEADGFREGVNKAIVLFSDGHSNRCGDPVKTAFKLRHQDVTIITVGVPEGDGSIDKQGFKELVGIAGDVSHEFNCTSLSEIDNVVSDLETLLPCGNDNRTTTTGPPPTRQPATTATIDPDWTTTTDIDHPAPPRQRRHVVKEQEQKEENVHQYLMTETHDDDELDPRIHD